MTVRDPVARGKDLPVWSNNFVEPERPQVQIMEHGRQDIEISLQLHDQVSAEWLAYWLTSRPAWNAFLEWLDNRR